MAVTKDQIKEICRKHVRTSMTSTGVTTGADLITGTDADGNPQFTLSKKTGNIAADEDAVDRQAEMLASILMDIFPLLEVQSEVQVSTSTGSGKGHGSVS